MSATREKLPLLTKVAFGVGSVGDLIYIGMFNTFLGIFYNQAIGLSNSLIGLAIMLAMLGDAISDPVVGMISDRWKSRLGRRHPFLFAAPIPLGVAIFFIFNPPDILTNASNDNDPNQLWLFIYLAVLTIFSRICHTLYVIPHLALGGELTKDPNDRSSLFSINSIFGYASGALFAFTAWGFFLGGESTLADGSVVPKHLDATAYGPLVFTACGLVIATIWLSAFGTRNRIALLSDPPSGQKSLSMLQFYRDLSGALRNRNYRFIMLGFFFFMLSVGLNETFNVFVNTYFWELETKQIRWFGLASIPAILAGAVISPIFMRFVERKIVLIFGLSGIVIFVQTPIILRLFELMPANGASGLLPILLTSAAGVAFCLAASAVAILSMLGDVSDENELMNGLRQEGLIYSARAFFAKASNSAGQFIAGVALDVYVRLPFEAVPGEVDEGVIIRLGIAAGPIMSIGAIIAIPLYAQYRLTRKQHLEILDSLGAKAARQSEQDATAPA